MKFITALLLTVSLFGMLIHGEQIKFDSLETITSISQDDASDDVPLILNAIFASPITLSAPSLQQLALFDFIDFKESFQTDKFNHDISSRGPPTV